MRKTIISISIAGLASIGLIGAHAADLSVITIPGIHSTTSKTPTLSAGYGQFFSVVNTISGEDLSSYVITNQDGNTFPIVNQNGTNYVTGNLTYKDKYFASNGSDMLQIPFMLQGPMDLGHINFDSASAALDSNDKLILNAMAKEVVKTGLKGIYLVGKADPIGSYAGNLAISEKRVNAAATYLESRLNALGVTDAQINTEYMGDLLALGQSGQNNLEDRRVEVTIYPLI